MGAESVDARGQSERRILVVSIWGSVVLGAGALVLGVASGYADHRVRWCVHGHRVAAVVDVVAGVVGVGVWSFPAVSRSDGMR